MYIYTYMFTYTQICLLCDTLGGCGEVKAPELEDSGTSDLSVTVLLATYKAATLCMCICMYVCMYVYILYATSDVSANSAARHVQIHHSVYVYICVCMYASKGMVYLM